MAAQTAGWSSPLTPDPLTPHINLMASLHCSRSPGQKTSGDLLTFGAWTSRR